MVLSKPELLLLQSAEENPLEYTLAEYEDAFLYVRVLLKLLHQVTATHHSAEAGDTGTVASLGLGRVDCGVQIPLSREEALDVYSHDKMGVVTHYVITKLYELMGSLIERQQQDQQRNSRNNSPKNRHPTPSVSILTLFYDGQDHDAFARNNPHPLIDDWRPLMKILHRSTSDDFSKRGAALVLAYILMAGCDEDQITRSKPNGEGILLDPITPLETQKICQDRVHEVTEILQSLISWLTSRLQSSHTTSLCVVTPTLMILATIPQARRAFDQVGGIGYLVRHVKIFHRNHQRHKQVMNRRRKVQHGRPSSMMPIRQKVSSRGGRKNAAEDDSSMLLQSVSSTLSKTFFEAPQQLRIVSPSATRPSRSENGNERSFVDGATSSSLSEVSSSLVSQMANMLPSPTSLNMIAEKNHRLSPPTLPNINVESNNDNYHTARSSFAATNGRSMNTNDRSNQSAPSSSVQQLYELVFTLWCMALDCPEREEVRQHFARDGAVSALVQLLQTAPREKILRLSLATLRVLATLDTDSGQPITTSLDPLSDGNAKITSTTFVRGMIACDIQKPLDLLQQREWNDPDLQNDLNVLCATVHVHTRELTQWKVYRAELESGVLSWSSGLHCSKFFRQNVRHMEGPEGDFAPLQRLVKILYDHTQNGRMSAVRGSKTMYVGLNEVIVSRTADSAAIHNGLTPQFSWDQDDINDEELCETLAVALYDIGEFARHYPNGRGVIAAAGRLQRTQLDQRDFILGKTKSLVMQYMQHPREEVQEQALSCISKLLVQNWNVGESLFENFGG